MLGAFEKDRLIGIIKISKQPLYKLRHIAIIGSMYVSPEYRGSGAGKALMTKAISQAKKMKDTEQLHLSVTSTNEPGKNSALNRIHLQKKITRSYIFHELREQQL